MESNKNDFYLKMAEAIAPHRKRSERFVGFVPYCLNYEIRKYTGVSKKPFRINVFNRTIINLIGRGIHNMKSIAEVMGLNIQHDLEKMILTENLNEAKTKLELIQGSNNNLTLTSKGTLFYERGELIQTFESPFEIIVVPSCPYFPFLKYCIADYSEANKKRKKVKKDELTLNQIKFIAETQASHVQHKERNLELVETVFNSYNEAEMSFYICFMQDVRDNSVRTIIYDETQNAIIPQLSLLFDGNDKLRDRLLKKCLKKELEDEEIEKVESGEKPEEQIQAEENLIAEVEEKGEDIAEDEILRKKVGSIYDSVEFEKELHDIFELHDNQEIWLISPWIRNYAFLKSREPHIRKFLDQGGTVFIGYSEPEKLGEEMVEPMSMQIIERLDANYDRFYFAELPKFHYKNVIEYKENTTTLYTGSFNVLSFCINENTEHYRMEQMMLANEDSAVSTRQGYLKLFAQKYVNQYVAEIDSIQNGSTLKAPKLSYLNICGVLQEHLISLKEKTDEKSIVFDMTSISEISRDELMDIAIKIVSMKYDDDQYFIQALLSAYLFLFNDAKNSNDIKGQDYVVDKLHQLLKHNSIYKICKFWMRPGYENEKKSVVRIIHNDITFEFGDISLSKDVFKIVFKHRENINFKEGNFRLLKGGGIAKMLYNSSKAILKF